MPANFPTSEPGLKVDYADNTDDVMAANQNQPNMEVNAIGGFIGANGAKLIADRTEKTTPVDADMVGLMDSAASNVLKKLSWANIKATLKTYFDTIYPPPSGWMLYSAVTPTRTTADDPTYILTFAGVDLTGTMSIGMKVRFTQNSAVVYGIITAVAFSTNTTVTLYCGTDYDVLDTATYPISAFYYSPAKTPRGFPMSPEKWTVEVTDVSARVQATPTQNVWYNLGSIQISMPIGSWRTIWEAFAELNDNSDTAHCEVTLSSANNSESDARFTAGVYAAVTGATGVTFGALVGREKLLIVAAKTTLYLNARSVLANMSNIYINGAINKTVISLTCAYL